MTLLDKTRLEKFVSAASATLPAQLDSCRLFHGRGQCYEGRSHICVDFYYPVLLAVFFKEPGPGELETLEQELSELMPTFATCLLVQRRDLPGSPTHVLAGQMPEHWQARRGDLTFRLSLQGQQNPGYFLDMEPGREWLEQQCQGRRVLNLFAYTCAFSVVALAAGASKVVNVDMSKQALARGRDNHRDNNLDLRACQFMPLQIQKSWSRIKKSGPYDVVILDPPSFQKGSFVAKREYAKLVRRLPELLPEGGDVLACLNAPELAPEFIEQVFQEQCPQAEYVKRLAASEQFPDQQPMRQLKLTHWRLSGSEESA